MTTPALAAFVKASRRVWALALAGQDDVSAVALITADLRTPYPPEVAHCHPDPTRAQTIIVNRDDWSSLFTLPAPVVALLDASVPVAVGVEGKWYILAVSHSAIEKVRAELGPERMETLRGKLDHLGRLDGAPSIADLEAQIGGAA